MKGLAHNAAMSLAMKANALTTSSMVLPNSISNGDVEMASDDDEDDDGPLEPLPLPKVRP
jgi:hypothetical protein